MRLRFLGHAAFDLQIEGQRLCLDPHRPGALGGRFELPEIVGPFDALVVSHSHEDHAAWTPALGTMRWIDADTDIGALQMRFRAVPHDAQQGLRMGMSRMMSLQGEGLRIVHCGDVGCWNDQDVCWLRGCDLLLVPVGGTFTVDGAGAAELVEAVEPSWVVPMHAADPRVDLALEGTGPFIEALGWPCVDLQHFDSAAPPDKGTVLRLPSP